MSPMRLILVSVSITTAVVVSGVRAQEGQSRELRGYVDAAIDTLRRISLHRGRVNWSVLRDSAHKLASGAAETRDLYPVIDWLLRRVDKHSFLQAGWFGVRGAVLRDRFGYVRVPFAPGGDMKPTLADSLQNILRRLDEAATCGWIVDLRHNGGGNMWPMLAGIGPLLGDSVVGWSQTESGRSLWKYRNGVSILVHEDGREEELVKVSVSPHTMRQPNAPVAVLIDGATGSSGEVMVTAFQGRPFTRFFGSPTAGVSTANKGFRLPDGANMVITVGVYADRTGTVYGEEIRPDEVVLTPLRGPTVLGGDPVLGRAMEWLGSEGACR